MPPGGSSSYGSGHENSRPKRFNFPSAPSRHIGAPAGEEREQPAPQRQQQQPPPQRRQQQEPPQRQHPQAPQRQQPQPPRYDDRQYDQGPPPRIQTVEPMQPPPRSAPETGGAAGRVDRVEQQPLVRPYAMTGGRTRPRYQLAIEALVHTSADPARLQGQLPEHQRICRLCYEIKSVAEISALLSIPLGVARILVADLAEAGLVAIHQPGGDETNADGQPDVTLLERVLSGLRKL